MWVSNFEYVILEKYERYKFWKRCDFHILAMLSIFIKEKSSGFAETVYFILDSYACMFSRLARAAAPVDPAAVEPMSILFSYQSFTRT